MTGKRIYIPENHPAFARFVKAFAYVGAEVNTGVPAVDCDALVLPGGGDVHPRYYFPGDLKKQAIAYAKSRLVSEEQDQLELALLEKFIKQGKPVLGICRGIQVINVYFGGTLLPDIPGHHAINGRDQMHSVYTLSCAGSPFYELYGSETMVNSAHHQAIERIGNGLQIAQQSHDGIIEAVIHEIYPIWAVQWHPERMPEQSPELFSAFLALL